MSGNTFENDPLPSKCISHNAEAIVGMNLTIVSPCVASVTKVAFSDYVQRLQFLVANLNNDRQGVRYCMLCDKCHWFMNENPFKYCDFCLQVSIPENMLCSILRISDRKERNDYLSKCNAYRPFLTTSERLECDDLTHADKNIVNYKEELIDCNHLHFNSDPNVCFSKIQHHVCLVVNHRCPVLLAIDDCIKNMYIKIPNAQVEVLYISCDHAHFYINISQEMSLDLAVKTLANISEKEIISLYPELSNKPFSFWLPYYFTEVVGRGFLA